jgi:nitrite reductase/ring-hydroxylating ferredoxin subunit
MLRVDQPDAPPLAAYNVDGEFYVTSNICTHNIAMLTDGYLEGDIVECPLHGGCFNVKTGAPTSFPCEKPLQTYAATVEDGALYVEI